jgi:glycosyltransferase 2 family protein
MIKLFKQIYAAIKRRPFLLTLIKIAVSLSFILILIDITWNVDVTQSLGQVSIVPILCAATINLLGLSLNCIRWKILLKEVGIDESLGKLISLYLMGLFFSLFLPSSVGGDAVRVYEVAKRSKLPVEAFWATLQERVFGMGAFMLVGLMATLYLFSSVPSNLRVWAIILQSIGVAGSILLFYPAWGIRLTETIWGTVKNHSMMRRLIENRYIGKITNKLLQTHRPTKLQPFKVLSLTLLALLSALLGTITVYILGKDMGINVSILSLCMITSLILIVRMLPVSLNGIGVGEGAFVYLMGLFNVPHSSALALALVTLALQTAFAISGGLIIAFRISKNSWVEAKNLYRTSD